MGGRAWTDDERSLAKQMNLLGHNAYAIAERLGRTRSAIRNFLDDGTRRHKLGLICSDCPRPVADCNKTGRCKRCATSHNNRTPGMREKKKAGWKKRMADPVKYAKLCRQLKENFEKAMRDPVKRAAAVERGRQQYHTHLNTPEMRARLSDPALLKLRGAKVTEGRLAWCPIEYRDDYLHLIYSKRLPKNEARAVVLNQVQADIARLSPFERQDRALRNGAGLVAK